MEQPTENNKASAISTKTIVMIATVVVLAVIIAAVAVVSFVLLNNKEETVSEGFVPYAKDTKIVSTEDELKEAWEKAMENAQNGRISLRYQNDAFSSDGVNFECLLANSSSNVYDMFLTIYADEELTDQIFLSGLVPPGSGFEEITLDHPLDVGDHTVYVALTQVKTDENGEQVIVGQAIHTAEFHVSEKASSTSE